MLASATTAYRRILTRPGTALFSGAGLVARLPISMLGLGIVLLVEHETGSYAMAGAISATALVANAACAVPQGRLIDRHGQTLVLPALITVWAIALAGLMASVTWAWTDVTTYACAALCGASMPSVGTCVRARWSAALTDKAEIDTAFALEAVADESVFLVGPIAVTLLATAFHPVAGLAAALATGLLGTYAFASLRSTAPPPHPPVATGTARPPMPWPPILPLTLVSGALGLLFGATEVTTVAFAEEEGHPAAAGFLLAIWALGSLVAGLVSGSLSSRSGPLVRLRWGALGMTVAMAPLALVPSVPVMALVLLLGGLAISPTLIAAMSLAEQSLPPARLTEGMSYLQTGLLAGVAPGAAVAGVVIETHGASPSYLVALTGGVVALGAALLTRVPASVRSHEHVG